MKISNFHLKELLKNPLVIEGGERSSAYRLKGFGYDLFLKGGDLEVQDIPIEELCFMNYHDPSYKGVSGTKRYRFEMDKLKEMYSLGLDVPKPVDSDEKDFVITEFIERKYISSVFDSLKALEKLHLAGFYHGDSHIGNVINPGDGRMIWTDFETKLLPEMQDEQAFGRDLRIYLLSIAAQGKKAMRNCFDAYSLTEPKEFLRFELEQMDEDYCYGMQLAGFGNPLILKDVINEVKG